MIMIWVQPGTSNILAMSPCFTSCRLIQTPPVPQAGLCISHASRTLTYFTQQTWTNPRAQHENTVLCGNLIGPIHAHAAKGILWRSPSQKKFLTESRRTETTASAASCSAAWSSCCPNGRKARRYWNGRVKTPKGKTGHFASLPIVRKEVSYICFYLFRYLVSYKYNIVEWHLSAWFEGSKMLVKSNLSPETSSTVQLDCGWVTVVSCSQ